MAKVEYRVQWRRSAWKSTAVSPSQVFQRLSAVQRFIAKLGDKWPDVVVNVTVRAVDEWQNPSWWEGWQHIEGR